MCVSGNQNGEFRKPDDYRSPSLGASMRRKAALGKGGYVHVGAAIVARCCDSPWGQVIESAVGCCIER